MVGFTVRLLYSRGKSPGIHWIGGWMGPKTGMDDVEEKNLAPTGTRNPTPRPSTVNNYKSLVVTKFNQVRFLGIVWNTIIYGDKTMKEGTYKIFRHN
jgi:hypothetical protein